MTPTQARAFLAVAIEGSFSAGARRLNVSQPTVTSQVAAIERQYKVELFHRMGRGVRLTGAGQNCFRLSVACLQPSMKPAHI
jgi:DNA-binding transcriptional LysR family regulator